MFLFPRSGHHNGHPLNICDYLLQCYHCLCTLLFICLISKSAAVVRMLFLGRWTLQQDTNRYHTYQTEFNIIVFGNWTVYWMKVQDQDSSPWLQKSFLEFCIWTQRSDAYPLLCHQFWMLGKSTENWVEITLLDPFFFLLNLSFFLVHTFPIAWYTAFPFHQALWQKNTFHETNYCRSFYRGLFILLASPVAMVILSTTEALVSLFINSLECISTPLFLCFTADVGPKHLSHQFLYQTSFRQKVKLVR